MKTSLFSLGCVCVLSLVGCGVGPDEVIDDSTAADDQANVEEAVTFNACACLNPNQVIDCRSGGVCVSSSYGSGTDTYWCAAKKKTFTCRHIVKHTCRQTGYPKGSLRCCSGHAKYVGSNLVCTP